MSIKCQHCNHENPDNGRFCNNCGASLLEDTSHRITINEDDVNAQTKYFVNRFAENIKDIATHTKLEALEDFQEKATKWVRYQFIAVTTAASVIIAILAYVGFKGFNINEILDKTTDKYVAQLEKNKTEIEDGSSELSKIKNQVINEAKEQLSEIATLNKNMSEIKILRKDLDAKIAAINKLKTAVDQQASEIKKIERSRYKILVHYEIPQSKKIPKRDIQKLRTTLYKKGYIVGSEDILNVSTDRQEILYYSDTLDMSAKINEIIDTLPDEDKPIGKKLVKSGNSDPFQIVIKLCSIGQNSDLACKSE